MATMKGDIQSLEFSLSEVDRGSGFARPRALLEFRCALRGEQKEKRKTSGAGIGMKLECNPTCTYAKWEGAVCCRLVVASALCCTPPHRAR